MRLSPEVRAVIDRFVSQRPVPQGEPGPEFEEKARQWSTAIAEQLAFERPQDGFGKKRADPGRPISKDAIARQLGDRLLAWDMLTGAGTGHPTLVADPDSMDITGQVFVPVTPRNHVGAAAPSQPSPPSQPPGLQPPPSQPAGQAGSTADVAAVLAAIQDLARTVQDFRTATDARLADLANRVSAVEARPVPALPAIPPVVFPDYITSLPGGGALVLKPRN